MAKVIWTNSAIEDLKAIHEYISKDSIYYADKQIDRIVERVEILEKFPQIGRMVPEFNIGLIRELIEGNYRIIYRIESTGNIGIVRIHHSARSLKGL